MTELYKDPDPELLADLVDSWAEAAMKKQLSGLGYAREIAKKTLEWAAPILRQQGADMELEACLKWMGSFCATWTCGRRPEDVLRAARRPKPPSLKEQALAVLDDCANCLDGAHENIIRRALEALDD